MCELNKDLLQLYIDGQLNSLEKQLLDEHLRKCPSCRKELNALKILDWDLKEIGNDIEIPKELSAIRASSIRAFLMKDSENSDFNLGDVYKLQYNTFKNTLNFIQYMPGNSIIEASGKLLRKQIKTNKLLKIMGF